MITHIVLFKFTDRSPETVERAREMLTGMTGRVPSLREIEVGADVLHSARSYDLALITRFDSLDALAAYQRDPVHAPIAAELRAMAEQIAVVDFES